MSGEEWTDEQYRDQAKRVLRRWVIVGLFRGPVAAIGHALAGNGESSFGAALVLVLLASAIGALIGLIAGEQAS